MVAHVCGMRDIVINRPFPWASDCAGPLPRLSWQSEANMAHTLSTECDTAFRISLDVRSIHLTEDQFYLLCRDNRDLRLELSAQGELIIMPPIYTDTGWRCSRITRRLDEWAEKDGTGTSYGSSTGFTLPNGAK